MSDGLVLIAFVIGLLGLWLDARHEARERLHRRIRDRLMVECMEWPPNTDERLARRNGGKAA